MIRSTPALEDPVIVNPGGETRGPFDWLESGVRIAGFWAVDIGVAASVFQQGHLHPQPGFGGPQDGIAESIHSRTNDLPGLYVSVENGARFSVHSIDCAIQFLDTTNPGARGYSWSYAVDGPHLLISTAFDPTPENIEAQWTPFSTPTAPFDPWFSLPVAGSDDVGGVFITHTVGGLKVDTIVLDVAPLGGDDAVPIFPFTPSAGCDHFRRRSGGARPSTDFLDSLVGRLMRFSGESK